MVVTSSGYLSAVLETHDRLVSSILFLNKLLLLFIVVESSALHHDTCSLKKILLQMLNFSFICFFVCNNEFV